MRIKNFLRNKNFIDRKIANDIKLIVMDVDGVLTDGKIIIGNDGTEFKSFNVKDGMGIRLLQKFGIEVALISGGSGEVISKRASNLNIKHYFFCIEDKFKELSRLQNKLKISSDETAFLGDDINDLNVISRVRIFATPFDGHKACKKKADWIGKKTAGNGFVREFVDNLIIGMGKNPEEPIKTKNSL